MKKVFLLLCGLTVSLLAEDGAAIYNASCKICHGADASTAAMGKAAPIKGWETSKTIAAINEYKAGTRNTVGMGKVMSAKVKDMSDAQIAAVAEYISTLK